MSKEIDLRSYFPKFERTLTWIDGTKYQIREVEDLSEAEFHAMVDEEQRFAQMSPSVRAEANKKHLQSMLVVPIDRRVSARKGATSLDVEGREPVDLEPGDVIFVTDGLYTERNVVEDVKSEITVKEPW